MSLDQVQVSLATGTAYSFFRDCGASS